MAFELDPRLAADSAAVTALPLCEMRLMDEAAFPWLVLVPRRTGLRELIDLAAPDRAVLMEEVARACAVLQHLHAPHKLNVAALGNQVEQLHVHVIARFRHDAAWPRPVWGATPKRPYEPAALARAAADYRAAFA